jgi:ADP-ribose pyrophosphatase
MDEKMHLFLAKTLLPAKQNLEPDEIIRVIPVSLDDTFRMILQGKIVDGKTIISLFLAREKNLLL